MDSYYATAFMCKWNTNCEYVITIYIITVIIIFSAPIVCTEYTSITENDGLCNTINDKGKEKPIIISLQPNIKCRPIENCLLIFNTSLPPG